MRAYFVAAATLAYACAARAQIPAPRIRDSAGVRIVEHATIKNAPVAFTVDPRPTLDLGGLKDDPNEELDPKSPFLTAARLSDGRFVAVDYSSLKMFTAKGKFIRSIGRKGEGPGEFGQVLDVCVAPGDTIVALGYGNRRVSVFDSAGLHVRSFVTEGIVWAGACFRDGSLLVRANVTVNPKTTMTPEAAATLDRVFTGRIVRSDGKPLRDIGQFPGESFSIVQIVGNAYARGDSVYVGNGVTAEVRVYSASGRLTRVVRWDDPVVPITAAELDKRLQDMLPANCCGANREMQLQRMRSRPQLPNLPMYSLLVVDTHQRVWVQDSWDVALSSQQPFGWTLFDGAGRLLGRVVLPKLGDRQAEIAGFDGDQIILRWRDAEGAAHVSFHALARSK